MVNSKNVAVEEWDEQHLPQLPKRKALTIQLMRLLPVLPAASAGPRKEFCWVIDFVITVDTALVSK